VARQVCARRSNLGIVLGPGIFHLACQIGTSTAPPPKTTALPTFRGHHQVVVQVVLVMLAEPVMLDSPLIAK